MFPFKLKAVLQHCSQHLSKGVTFTLQAYDLCLQFVLQFSVSLPLREELMSICRHVGVFHANCRWL